MKRLTERALTQAYNEHDLAEFGAHTVNLARALSRVRQRRGIRTCARICAVIERLWYRFDN